jgi:hypothetical protein
MAPIFDYRTGMNGIAFEGSPRRGVPMYKVDGEGGKAKIKKHPEIGEGVHGGIMCHNGGRTRVFWH